MREIKFRAWYKGEPYPLDENDLQDYEKPRMIYDVQNAYDGSGFKDEFNALGWISNFSDFMDDERFILMQYTGLKDKNGTEIYEGDIIHSLSPFFTGEGTIHDYDDDYYEVVWMEEEARFCLKKKNGLYAYVDELIEPTVKGNIFENPEILEEQHG